MPLVKISILLTTKKKYLSELLTLLIVTIWNLKLHMVLDYLCYRQD